MNKRFISSITLVTNQIPILIQKNLNCLNSNLKNFNYLHNNYLNPHARERTFVAVAAAVIMAFCRMNGLWPSPLVVENVFLDGSKPLFQTAPSSRARVKKNASPEKEYRDISKTQARSDEERFSLFCFFSLRVQFHFISSVCIIDVINLQRIFMRDCHVILREGCSFARENCTPGRRLMY